jgi:hypothetical protein
MNTESQRKRREGGRIKEAKKKSYFQRSVFSLGKKLKKTGKKLKN